MFNSLVMKRSACALGLALAGGTALAQMTAPADAAGAMARSPQRAVAPTSESVRSKQLMVDKVLHQSQVPARIAASQDAQAQSHLAKARELFTHGRDLLNKGIVSSADSLFNDAIAELGRAQQLVPDPSNVQAEGRARYVQLEDSFNALKRTAAIAMPAGGKASSGALDLADELHQQAQAHANANRYNDANKALDQALVLLMKDAASRLTGQTLVYDTRFATPKEEYEYELSRYKNYERLVPLAVQEYKPTAEARALVQRHLDQGKMLRGTATGVAGKDWPAAVQHLQAGTEQLKRALSAAGLVVPQSMDTAP